MKIYLLSDNDDMVNCWYMYFMNIKDVEIICDDFVNFMNNSDVECIVSPANSFGLMDGGYDLAITEYFGDELQQNVQKYIIDNFYGEQPVGSSFIIKTNMYGRENAYPHSDNENTRSNNRCWCNLSLYA